MLGLLPFEGIHVENKSKQGDMENRRKLTELGITFRIT